MKRIKKEQEKIREWVENIDDFRYEGIDKSLNSYFNISENDEMTIIYEYQFQNIIELEKLLHNRKRTIHSEIIDKICAIAAFKERNDARGANEDVINEDRDWELPEFIYNM